MSGRYVAVRGCRVASLEERVVAAAYPRRHIIDLEGSISGSIEFILGDTVVVEENVLLYPALKELAEIANHLRTVGSGYVTLMSEPILYVRVEGDDMLLFELGDVGIAESGGRQPICHWSLLGFEEETRRHARAFPRYVQQRKIV